MSQVSAMQVPVDESTASYRILSAYGKNISVLLRISSVLAPTPEYTPDRIPEGARMDALTASIPIA